VVIEEIKRGDNYQKFLYIKDMNYESKLRGFELFLNIIERIVSLESIRVKSNLHKLYIEHHQLDSVDEESISRNRG